MKAIVFAAIAALCLVSFAADDWCTYTVNEQKYDLSSLGHTPGDRETVFHMLNDTSVITANLCGSTSLICPNKTSVCLRTTAYSYASRGDDGTMKLEAFMDAQDYGLVATFTTKETCGQSHYTTKVRLVCARVKKNQVVSTVGDDKSCEIEMVVKTRAVCVNMSSSSSSSSSSIPSSSTSSSISSESSAEPKRSSSAASTLLPSLALVVLALLALF